MCYTNKLALPCCTLVILWAYWGKYDAVGWWFHWNTANSFLCDDLPAVTCSQGRHDDYYWKLLHFRIYSRNTKKRFVVKHLLPVPHLGLTITAGCWQAVLVSLLLKCSNTWNELHSHSLADVHNVCICIFVRWVIVKWLWRRTRWG